MDPISTLALTLGAGWASGINLYAAVLSLGLMHNFGMVVLPPELQMVANPLVILAAGIMYIVEFFADKIPGVDSGWDAIHTFIRIPAGAVLSAGAVGDVDPALSIAAGILGGTLAAGSHVTKASTRLAINTSPEPFSNWAASITEDIAVIGGLWTALNHPIVFLVLLVLFVALVIWLVPKLFRFIKRVFQKIAALFGGKPVPAAATVAAASGPAPAPPPAPTDPPKT